MLNAEELAAERQKYEAQYGQVWDTTQLQADFDVIGFQAPFVVVSRKSDGKVGSLQFTHMPRWYHSFVLDK